MAKQLVVPAISTALAATTAFCVGISDHSHIKQRAGRELISDKLKLIQIPAMFSFSLP